MMTVSSASGSVVRRSSTAIPASVIRPTTLLSRSDSSLPSRYRLKVTTDPCGLERFAQRLIG